MLERNWIQTISFTRKSGTFSPPFPAHFAISRGIIRGNIRYRLYLVAGKHALKSCSFSCLYNTRKVRKFVSNKRELLPSPSSPLFTKSRFFFCVFLLILAIILRSTGSLALNVPDADEVSTQMTGWDARGAASTTSRVSRATLASDNFLQAKSSR